MLIREGEISDSSESEGPCRLDSGSAHRPPQATDWQQLVTMIHNDEPAGMEILYRLFSKGVRYYLCRQLGVQELDDKVHDTFLIVVNAIRRGDLRDPDRLMGFVRTVVRRQVAAYIDTAIHKRREQTEIEDRLFVADISDNPEEHAILDQKVELMEKVLLAVPRRDREILTRFYLNEESQEQICSEMHLTETQFRLLKSRAKARFGELGKRRLVRKQVSRFLLRNTAVA